MISDSVIHLGQRHDISFREFVIGMIPENAVAIMDRGFTSWAFLEELSAASRLFIVGIKKNMKTELNHNRFCDAESGEEFHLATNITFLSDKEISELYRKRWAIENLWKFLKMHLSLDKPMTKSENGLRIQIYMILITYLILELVELPEIWGEKLIDELRDVQLELSRRCLVVDWSFDWQPELRVT